MKKVFLLILVSLAGCQGPDWPAGPDGSVPDQSVISQIDYDNYWQYLTGADGGKFTENEIKIEYQDEGSYLRRCGGLMPYGYILKKISEEEDLTVNYQPLLIAHLGGIDSPEEAMAVIYATNCYLSPTFNEFTQFVNQTENGYEVGVIQYFFFGCGNHAHTQKVFSVKPDGSVELINEVKLERGTEFCGD